MKGCITLRVRSIERECRFFAAALPGTRLAARCRGRCLLKTCCGCIRLVLAGSCTQSEIVLHAGTRRQVKRLAWRMYEHGCNVAAMPQLNAQGRLQCSVLDCEGNMLVLQP